jgi:hypothetical protein
VLLILGRLYRRNQETEWNSCEALEKQLLSTFLNFFYKLAKCEKTPV